MKPPTFEETVRLYDKMIKNQMKKLSLYLDYEEYYQCGLIGLWRAYEQFEEGKGSFASYAMHTVRGYLLVQLTKEKRFKTRYACWEPSLTEQLVSNERTDDLHQYMGALSTQQRFIIGERFRAGRQLKEIAKELGMTYDRARYVYRSALKKIKEDLIKE
ncbi:sigma-70 family RNA polymerase sigma factor [Ectobacillus panaciterrae]|uniref:sigma-70 family RNA polymerase sigma factor n=1 Tax=Ectobacillus panaciterrae TaxID=363872 RepID=UPI0004102297|nr:sigma-70 family RNA polymerase sigma factor [Ectobacillus panaciterrae]